MALAKMAQPRPLLLLIYSQTSNKFGWEPRSSGDSCSEGRGFEFWCRILDGLNIFSHIFVVKCPNKKLKEINKYCSVKNAPCKEQYFFVRKNGPTLDFFIVNFQSFQSNIQQICSIFGNLQNFSKFGHTGLGHYMNRFNIFIPILYIEHKLILHICKSSFL